MRMLIVHYDLNRDAAQPTNSIVIASRFGLACLSLFLAQLPISWTAVFLYTIKIVVLFLVKLEQFQYKLYLMADWF